MRCIIKITDIEKFWLHVPFHEVPQRAMERNCHGWHIIEMCRVETDNGLVGWGETVPNYTWGRVSDAAIERARGANPFDLLWDDSLGAGLQMALYDVAGKAAEVPVHRLLGRQVRNWCPISWWGIDMSPQDYAAEAREAVKHGYTSFKQKTRPWWDIYEQIRLTAAEVGPNFKLDMDFNELLVNAANAIGVLQELDKTPQVAIYESPIPHADVPGNRRVRDSTRCAIAMHWAAAPLVTAMNERIVDGWVVSGGAAGVIKASKWCELNNMPFWLQLVGTAWTTTMAAHLAAVCSHAQWPAVTCMNMYVDQLVTEPIQVKGGYYEVSDKPGLGIDFDEQSLKWKVDSPDLPSLDAYNDKAIYAIVRDNGQKTWYEGEMTAHGYWPMAAKGNVPSFEHGVRLETWYNDGSKDWKKLAERVRRGPVSE